MNIVTIIQARMGSTRLPGKVLMTLAGKPVLQHVIDAAKQLTRKVVVVTSMLDEDLPIRALCELNHVECCYENNEPLKVADWFYRAIPEDADYVLRICGDSPFISVELNSVLIKLAKQDIQANGGADYYSYITKDAKPSILSLYGIFAELFCTSSFLEAFNTGVSVFSREHVTPIFYREFRYQMKECYIDIPEEIEAKKFKLSIDTADDLLNARMLTSRMRGYTNDIWEILPHVKEIDRKYQEY